MSTKPSAVNSRSLKRASALETLCWVRECLDSGADEEIVRVLHQREQDLAGQVGEAMRNSIDHQIFRVGRTNYHSHIFAVPVILEFEGPFDPAMLDLAPVLPILTKALRDNGLTGRSGMLFNRIVEHGTLTHMSPSDLYSIGKEMFMNSIAATSGKLRGSAVPLRALHPTDEAPDGQADQVEGCSYVCGHILGCIYSTRGEETRLDRLCQERLRPLFQSIVEFSASGQHPVRARIGRIESVCTALNSASALYAETLARNLFRTACVGPTSGRIAIFIDNPAETPLRSALVIDVVDADVVVSSIGMHLSMHEAGATEAIIEVIKHQALDNGIENVTVHYAASQVRH